MSQPIRFTLLVLTAGLLRVSAQTVGGCPVFPSDSVWNTRIDQLPVDANSAAYVTTIGTAKYLHPDFSASGGGIPFVVVPGTQPKVPIVFGDGAAESEPGPYPIPPNPPVENGGDQHVLVVDNGTCILYELYAAYPRGDGSWGASSGAVFNLRSNQLRPAGWTSADAAGLPILAGLVRYDEVLSGVINHALRMTAPKTRREYIWPARHRASSLTGTQYPPMGQRFRLKASFNISGFPRSVQVILTALKEYGAILADNGSSWYLTGEADPRWDDDELHTLHQILGANMEAVDESSLMVDADSGAAKIGFSALQRLTLSPTSLAAQAHSTGNSVVLSTAAPAGGVNVLLTSSNPAAASVPPSVLIGANATSAAFSIQAGTVSTATTVTITAFALGVSKTATLTITPSGLASIAASPTSVTGGTASSGTVNLITPAPSSGAVVSLVSSNPLAAKIPASVTVPAGALSVSFPITTFTQTSPTAVTLTASYGGGTVTGTISIMPSAVGLTASSVVLAPGTLAGGLATNCYVYISAPAGPSGMSVSVTSSNPAVAPVPAAVIVKPGIKYGYLVIKTAPVTAQTAVTISASAGGVTRSTVLTVNPAGIAGITVSPVKGGTTATATITLGGIAAAPTAVTVSSSLPATASVPASVTVPTGARTVTFPIATAPVAVKTSVRITIKCGASVLAATLVVNP